MSALPDPAHEAFAQARFTGKTLTEAYAAAGLEGGKTMASNLNRLPEIRERIAELYRESAANAAYEKTAAIGDLLAIIHAPPSEAASDHPLCEVRMGKDGAYHRFPSKLQALSRLIRLMGWIEPTPAEPEPKNYFKELLADARSRQHPSSSTGREPVGVAGSLPATSSLPSSTTPSPDPAPWVKLLPDDSRYQDHPKYSHGELTPRQEAFAQFRFQGMGVMAAYQAAGYSGETPNLAWRLNRNPAVKARITELNGGVEHALGYSREDAMCDLVTIIRATPAEATPDHPYCEMRMTSWGACHRFPSKLGAITLLARMLGWQPSTKHPAPHDPIAGFKSLATFLAARS